MKNVILVIFNELQSNFFVAGLTGLEVKVWFSSVWFGRAKSGGFRSGILVQAQHYSPNKFLIYLIIKRMNDINLHNAKG